MWVIHVVILFFWGEKPARPEFDVGGKTPSHVFVGHLEAASQGGTGTTVAAFITASWFFFGLCILGEEDGRS